MIDLSLSELLHVAERTLGPEVLVRDHGLLEPLLRSPANSTTSRTLPRGSGKVANPGAAEVSGA